MNYVDSIIAKTNPETWIKILEKRNAFQIETDTLINQVDENTTYDEAFTISMRAQRVGRLQTFSRIINQFKEPPEWASQLLLDVWEDAEIYSPIDGDESLPAHVHIAEFAKYFHQHRQQLSATLEKFKGQGDIQLYSGATLNRPSHSWTLSLDVAKVFAGRVHRHENSEGELLSLIIDGDKLAETACFYTDSRSEQEVYFLQDMRPSARLLAD
jgi:hypothetical protein